MSLRERYIGIISMLSALAKMGVYGPLDRIAGALTANSIKSGLYDAIRSVEAMSRQAIIAKVQQQGKNEPEEVTIIDYTEDVDDPRYHLAELGKVVEVVRGPSELEGKVIRYVRRPMLPSQEEIENFINEVQTGLSGLRVAQEIAMIALSPYPHKK